MSVDAEESMFGERATLARGLLFTALALGTLGVGIVDGGSHWFLTGVVLAANGAVDLFPVGRAVDHFCDTDRQRRQLRWSGAFAFLTGALAYIALVV
jgi:hypothetical protein